MKKRILFFNLVVVLSLVLASGCGSPATATPPESAGVTPTPPTIISPTPSKPQLSSSMQLGNDLPQTRLVPKSSVALADNRIGFVSEAQHIDQRAWAAGIKWMRLVPDPDGRWQHADWEKNEYTVDPNEDRIVDALVANKIQIMLVLDVWNTWSRSVYYKSDEDIALYLKWVRYMVNHFRGRIAYYEILNEPDLSFEKPSGMPLDAYVHLVKVTVPVIREEDPDAKIVVGAVPNTLWNGCREWMWGLLNSDVMPLVDGFSWHAMYGVTPSDDPRGEAGRRPDEMSNYWENYPTFVEEIKSVAASNGFKGEYMTEEMCWRTADSRGSLEEPVVFTDTAAAKYYARAIIIHLGLDVTTGLSWPPDDVQPISYSVIRALSTVMAGVQQPADLPVTIESKAGNIKYYGFTLSNGDKLFAVWTDGPAVDDDPGVGATLTFSASSAQTVTGIDVLNGFEQELVAENENGNLVIRDLLVKDYPIIIRFSGASFAESRIVEPAESLVEPVTIKLRKNAQERVPSGTPIQLTTNWLADSQVHATDFLSAASLRGTLDGQQLPDLNGSWGKIEPYQDRGYITYWLYPLGVLSPGTHNLEIWCTLSQPVTDGYDTNNDGQPEMYSGEVWRFTIQIEIY